MPIKRIHPPDSIQIDSYDMHDLINIFSKSEKFYCYDLYSFHSTISVLCGCVTIICPPYAEDFKKENWHSNEPLLCNGMAFGDNIHEIHHAKITQGGYKELFLNITGKNEQNLINIFEQFQEYINFINNEQIILDLTNNYYTFTGYNCEIIGSLEHLFPNNHKFKKYKAKYRLEFWEISCDFCIHANNVEYANLFDMNYPGNQGPRLEYHNGKLGLVLGSSYYDHQKFNGYIIDNINVNIFYKLHIILRCNYLEIYINNILVVAQQVIYTPLNFNNIILGKGFNESRNFKGIIHNFKLTVS
jgi:hypothetical protein